MTHLLYALSAQVLKLLTMQCILEMPVIKNELKETEYTLPFL